MKVLYEKNGFHLVCHFGKLPPYPPDNTNSINDLTNKLISSCRCNPELHWSWTSRTLSAYLDIDRLFLFSVHVCLDSLSVKFWSVRHPYIIAFYKLCKAFIHTSGWHPPTIDTQHYLSSGVIARGFPSRKQSKLSAHL